MIIYKITYVKPICTKKLPICKNELELEICIMMHFYLNELRSSEKKFGPSLTLLLNDFLLKDPKKSVFVVAGNAEKVD